ncbi:Protein CBG00510, partial [Caenorhabditis briggsae]
TRTCSQAAGHSSFHKRFSGSRRQAPRGVAHREPGNSQFSGTSTEYSGKETTEKEEGRKTGTSEVSNSLISRKFPADNFCQSYSTKITSSPPPLGPSSKKTKADRSRSFDAVPVNTMTAEENNITFN